MIESIGGFLDLDKLFMTFVSQADLLIWLLIASLALIFPLCGMVLDYRPLILSEGLGKD